MVQSTCPHFRLNVRCFAGRHAPFLLIFAFFDNTRRIVYLRIKFELCSFSRSRDIDARGSQNLKVGHMTLSLSLIHI